MSGDEGEEDDYTSLPFLLPSNLIEEDSDEDSSSPTTSRSFLGSSPKDTNHHHHLLLDNPSLSGFSSSSSSFNGQQQQQQNSSASQSQQRTNSIPIIQSAPNVASHAGAFSSWSTDHHHALHHHLQPQSFDMFSPMTGAGGQPSSMSPHASPTNDYWARTFGMSSSAPSMHNFWPSHFPPPHHLMPPPPPSSSSQMPQPSPSFHHQQASMLQMHNFLQFQSLTNHFSQSEPPTKQAELPRVPEFSQPPLPPATKTEEPRRSDEGLVPFDDFIELGQPIEALEFGDDFDDNEQSMAFQTFEMDGPSRSRSSWPSSSSSSSSPSNRNQSGTNGHDNSSPSPKHQHQHQKQHQAQNGTGGQNQKTPTKKQQQPQQQPKREASSPKKPAPPPVSIPPSQSQFQSHSSTTSEPNVETTTSQPSSPKKPPQGLRRSKKVEWVAKSSSKDSPTSSPNSSTQTLSIESISAPSTPTTDPFGAGSSSSMTPAEAFDTPSLTPRGGLVRGRKSAEIKRERDTERGYLGDDDPMLEDSNDFLKVLREIQLLDTQSVVSSDVETPPISDTETSSALLESESEIEKASSSLSETDNEKPFASLPVHLGALPEDIVAPPVKDLSEKDIVDHHHHHEHEPKEDPEPEVIVKGVDADPVVDVEDHKDERVGDQPLQEQPEPIPGSDSIQESPPLAPSNPPTTFQLILAFLLPLLTILGRPLKRTSGSASDLSVNVVLFVWDQLISKILLVVSTIIWTHKTTFNILKRDLWITATIFFVYLFPILASPFTYYHPTSGVLSPSSAAPSVLWYAFFFWAFLNRSCRTSPRVVVNLFLLIMLAFVCEVVCSPRQVLIWNGGDRLVLSLVLLCLKSNNFFKLNCFLPLSLFLMLSTAAGNYASVQWVILVLSVPFLYDNFFVRVSESRPSKLSSHPPSRGKPSATVK